MEEKNFIKINTLHAILHEAKAIQEYMNRLEGIAKDLKGDLNALYNKHRDGIIDVFEYSCEVTRFSQEYANERDKVLEELNKFLSLSRIEAEIG